MDILGEVMREKGCKQCDDSDVIHEDGLHERKGFRNCSWVNTFQTSKKVRKFLIGKTILCFDEYVTSS